MLPRQSRRRRDTGPMFPFGEIMLPVIGLVALGILIIAVKMFFIPSQEGKSYNNISDKVAEKDITSVITPEQKVRRTEKTETIVTRKGDNENKVVYKNNENAIAVPVSGASASNSSGSKQESVTGISSAPVKDRVKTEAQSATTSPTGVNSSDSDWGVQIGSFRESVAAENLLKKARNQGYSAMIERTTVKGNEYHRVIVLAGKTRDKALQVEKKLKDFGYPTYVKSLK